MNNLNQLFAGICGKKDELKATICARFVAEHEAINRETGRGFSAKTLWLIKLVIGLHDISANKKFSTARDILESCGLFTREAQTERDQTPVRGSDALRRDDAPGNAVSMPTRGRTQPLQVSRRSIVRTAYIRRTSTNRRKQSATGTIKKAEEI